MNEKAFATLDAFPHFTCRQTNSIVYKWKFLDQIDDSKMLEFKSGYIVLRTCHYYTEELFVYSIDRERKYFERVSNVDEWLEENLCHLEKTRNVYKEANEVVDKISSPAALGPNVCCASDEYGWVVKAPKIQAKIFVDLYKDPNQKTIKLEYSNNNDGSKKTKSGLVDKKQLYSFLKKNMTILKEKLVEVKPQDIDHITTKLEETKIDKEEDNNTPVSSIPYHMMSKEEKERLRNNSKLFIPIPKEQRIAYQSCKPIRRKFDYLLDELKQEQSKQK